MNTIQRNYAKHMKDVHGVENAVLPNVNLAEVPIGDLYRRVQPILLYDGDIRRLAGRGKNDPVWDVKREGTTTPCYELLRLYRPCEIVMNSAAVLADSVAMSLGLEGVVRPMDDGKLNVAELQKMLKTVRWMKRNLR